MKFEGQEKEWEINNQEQDEKYKKNKTISCYNVFNLQDMMTTSKLLTLGPSRFQVQPHSAVQQECKWL